MTRLHAEIRVYEEIYMGDHSETRTRFATGIPIEPEIQHSFDTPQDERRRRETAAAITRLLDEILGMKVLEPADLVEVAELHT